MLNDVETEQEVLKRNMSVIYYTDSGNIQMVYENVFMGISESHDRRRTSLGNVCGLDVSLYESEYFTYLVYEDGVNKLEFLSSIPGINFPTAATDKIINKICVVKK